MAQISYPFSRSPILTQEQWSKIAQNWLATGVIKGQPFELLVYADSTGMQVKVGSGQAFIKGHFYENETEEILAISSANSINPRIDRVVLRLDWIESNIRLAVLQGVPAVSPTPPGITQNSSRWEIPLAQVRVNAGASTIAAGNVTDERNFVRNANAHQGIWTYAALQNGWGDLDSAIYGVASYLKDSLNFVHLRGVISGGTTTDAITLFTLPEGLRPIRAQIFSTSTNNGTTELPARIHIVPDGRVQAYKAQVNHLILNGVSFSVE